MQSSGITPRDSKVGGDIGGESTSTCVVSGTGTSGAMVDSKVSQYLLLCEGVDGEV